MHAQVMHTNPLCILHDIDKVQLIMIPRQALCMCAQVYNRYQGIPLVIRGDLCDLVRVGKEYSVIGVPTHRLSDNDQHTTIDTIIEVRGC